MIIKNNGDWGLGIGETGMGEIPQTQSPNPNPPVILLFISFLFF